MSGLSFIAALPMYDWPERRAEVDAEWAEIRERLRRRGIPAPDGLVRRNADMPPVPGGIRDADGNLIAPDPSLLPPETLDLPTLWRHPALIYAQTCYGPMEHGLASHVTVIADPDYSGIEGGEGRLYSSVLVMRRDLAQGDVAASEGRPAPEDGASDLDIETLRGKRLAFNERQSISGYIALQQDLEALGQDLGLGLFSQRLETGAHRASLQALALGSADVAAIDARSWMLAKTYSPDITGQLIPIGWTARRPGLPFIAANAQAHFFTG